MKYFNNMTQEYIEMEDICTSSDCNYCTNSNNTTCRNNIDYQNIENNDFIAIKHNIEKNILLKVLNKVNKMANSGSSLYDIRMCLFNSWAKYVSEDNIDKNYDII